MCPFSEPQCSRINQALQIIGDKWSGLIIYQLSAGAKHFCELEQVLHIGPRTLSQRLDSLAEKGILAKQIYADSPARAAYSLTASGRGLVPILERMAEWGEQYSGGDHNGYDG